MDQRPRRSLHDSASWSKALADPTIARVLAVVRAELAHAWTVEQLAAVGGLSRTMFAGRFAALIGEPPLTYLTRWRMITAARLLRDTDKTLAQIASAVGYGSAFAFAKTFRRECAATPGDYRTSAPG